MAQYEHTIGYHEHPHAEAIGDLVAVQFDKRFEYTFDNFFHPYVGRLIGRLNRASLPGMMDADWHKNQLTEDFFNALYHPVSNDLVKVNYFPKEIDVSAYGAYSGYNWELFFHIPLSIAVHLSKTQRFAEAQRWFHYIFDPTANDKSVDPPARYWKFLAFRKEGNPRQIDELLTLLSKPPSELTDNEEREREARLNEYTAILNKPFRPHVVARTRPIAYQYTVVMKYLDNLIAWGDQLFQQDTGESINEATQRYVLAANLLGPRPQRIPERGAVQPKTYAQLKARGMDAMGNAIVELESQFPFNFTPTAGAGGASGAPLFGIGRTLYFCVPRNDKLLGYWDTVADRLFKIRNCMNIAGVVRPLALFDPPIDPGMLVKAAAAGIDIGSIVSGLNKPVGPIRSLPLIRKSIELCDEVRQMGRALLESLEKGDAEHLATVRQGHETAVHEMLQEVRFLQLKFTEESTESLLTTRDAILDRYKYYQRQLDLPDDPNVSRNLKIKRSDLTEDNFDDAYAALVGTYDKAITLQKPGALKKAGDSSPAQQSGATGAGQLHLTQSEDDELNQRLSTARDIRLAASLVQTAAPVLSLIPDFKVDLSYWGLGADSEIFGGKKLSAAAKFAADILKIVADYEKDKARMAKRKGEHERRANDWLREFNFAAHELMQVGRQILTSMLAEQVARHDYEVTKKQIENSKELDEVLREKFTNEELYTWMQGEISRLYYEFYRFAFDTARKAEQTMKHELMRPELDSRDFVKFNYWDGGRKGLLCGEALYLDLKRMELAYHENNKRELELSRDVSLRQLDPLALLTLRSIGTCQIVVPEWLYDRDCPGHYLRRIRRVALSISSSQIDELAPVHCTLTLLRSTMRKTSNLKDGEYTRQGTEDDRFVDYTGSLQSVVTSGTDRSSGMFAPADGDERFLPFEGAGAESAWKLSLPESYAAFDYAAISDVILHIEYTARQGIPPNTVGAALGDLFQQTTNAGPGFAQMFSLHQDFASEWSDFVNGSSDFQATIRRGHFPYFTQGSQLEITDMELYAEDVAKHHKTGEAATATTDLQNNQEFVFSAAPDSAGPMQVLRRNESDKVFLIVRYSLQ